MTKVIASKIVFALECGVNKHLDRSIVYSPLRFFYNRFKKNNPQTIQNARSIIANDIRTIIAGIANANSEMFVESGEPNEIGKKLLQRNYNIGINLLKKELTVVKAFKVITNSGFRMQIYNYILALVKKSISDFVQIAIKNKGQ